jgi:rubrerythrin
MTNGEQVAKILADILDGCLLVDPCNKIWALEGWCKDHCKPGQQEPDSECWLKYAEAMVEEAENSNKSSLTQNTLDVPDANVGGMKTQHSAESATNLQQTCNKLATVAKDTNVPCKDTISRTAAIDAVTAWLHRGCNPLNRSKYNEGEIDAYKTALSELKKIPSAEPERNKGEWVGTEFDGYADGNPVYCEWKCSACGCVVEDEEPTWNYCPNCGADMRGEQDG